jgi:hypothetical protein
MDGWKVESEERPNIVQDERSNSGDKDVRIARQGCAQCHGASTASTANTETTVLLVAVLVIIRWISASVG